MNPDPNPDELEEIAIAWLVERDEGFSPERAQEFVRWLQADPRHGPEIARLEKPIGLLADAPKFRATLQSEFGVCPPKAPVASAVPRRRPVFYTAAWAGLAAALMVGVFFGVRIAGENGGTRYATEEGGYTHARLDDGSTLELNAASSAVVSYSGTRRQVDLVAGEAHFAVTPDAQRPFVVRAGPVTVRAVGTAFNVRRASDGTVEVTVVEGRVALERDTVEAKEDEAFVDAGQHALLTPSAPSPQIAPLPPEALGRVLAWQTRLAVFDEVPLREIVSRFNERNRLQLRLAESSLGALPVGGTFALNDPEAFARMLTHGGEIVAERRSDSEIELRRAR